LKECIVLGEAPKNFGFGKAALSLSKFFQMPPPPEVVDVTIPLTWRLSFGAPPRATPTPTITLDTLPWALTPTQVDVIAAFPAGATGKTESGQVKMTCAVAMTGDLGNCSVTNVEPAGLGFEEAALGLAKKFHADIDWRLGVDADVRVAFAIQFAAEGSLIWKERNLGKINWLQTADLPMAQRAFPADALKAGLSSGSAVLDCTVVDNGGLTGCVPQSESPPGLGFGKAIAEVAEHYVMSPWTTTGLPAGGAHILLPMKLVHGAGDPAPTPAIKP
jgi:hypothetical protein